MKTAEANNEALSGVKVLEYAEFVNGCFCSRILADFGAKVIKIEKPDKGDSSRRRGPFPNDSPHPERSALFLYLNTNKLGITLNVEHAKGKEIFRELVGKVDILIENNPAKLMDKLGLGYEHLSKINPRLIMTSITPFGQTGPYSDYKSYYLNTFHAGGEGFCLPGGLGWILYSDQPPIKIGGYIGEYNTGVCAAIATLAALLGCEMTGVGQHIDVSQQEALIGLTRHELNDYNIGIIQSRATRSFPVAGLMQCKDGFVQLMPLEEHMWWALVELMGNPEWVSNERYKWENVSARFGHEAERSEVNKLLEEWVLTQTAHELYQKCQKKGCAIGLISTPEDLLNSEQLKAREFWVNVNHKECGVYKSAGFPYKYSRTPPRIKTAAPLLGEHNERIYCQELGYRKDELVRLRQSGII